MNLTTKTRTGKEVIEAMLQAETPAGKAKATRLQREYVAQRAAEGKDPKKVLGGIRSRFNRLREEAGKKVAAPKKAAKAKTSRAR